MKYIYFSLLFLICSAENCSNKNEKIVPNVVILNQDFEKYLIEKKIDTDGIINGKISDSDAEKVTSLLLGRNYTNLALTSIEGIQLFKNLTYLDCIGVGLKSLDVSANTKLEEVYCGSNNFENLDFSKNLQLRNLVCDRIKSLDIKNCRNLETLKIYDGSLLSDLDISNNINLKEFLAKKLNFTMSFVKNSKLVGIELDNCKQKNLNISQNFDLKFLYCRSGQLKNIDLSSNENLSNLDCIDNELEILDLSKNTKISALWLSMNKLTKLDLTKLGNIYEVICNNNKIETICVKHLTQIEILSKDNFTQLKVCQ